MGAVAIQLLIQYRYVLIFPLTIIEGPIVMMTTGFLLRLDYFSFFPLFFTLMLGDLAGDILWYAIGYFGGMHFISRFGKYINITHDSIAKVEKIFHRHHSKILFTSKITMGFGFAMVTLFTAGLTRIPFMRYLTFNILGGFIWTAALMGIGYYLGDVYVTVGRGIEIVAIGAAIVIGLAIFWGFSQYVRSIYNKNV